MAKISSLTLKNFKSFRHLENFEMRDLNILIGRNGSGKSNLLSFFKLMREGAHERLRETILGMGGMEEITWRGEIQRGFAGFIATLKLIENLSDIELGYVETSYSFEVTNEDPTMFFEEYIRRKEKTYYHYILGSEHTIFDQQTGQYVILENVARKGGEFILSRLRDPVRYGILDYLRSEFSKWEITRSFSDHALANLYDSQRLDIVDPLTVKSDGSNLISVLYALRDNHRPVYDELEETMQEVFPEFKYLKLPLVASGRSALYWVNHQGWEFPAQSTSDGMLRFLGLATLLLLPEPPPLIAIDEPEVGLHPRLLPRLAELIVAASKRTQIVITTHSPQLISAKGIQPEDIVITEFEDGATQLKRLSATELTDWLERFTVGALWTMGRIGG